MEPVEKMPHRGEIQVRPSYCGAPEWILRLSGFEPVVLWNFLIAIGLHFYPLDSEQKSITESYFNVTMMYDQNAP